MNHSYLVDWNEFIQVGHYGYPTYPDGDAGVSTITVIDSGSAIIVLMNGINGNLCSVYSAGKKTMVQSLIAADWTF